ncbi:MAG: acyl-CoA dehydrogenase family protein [Myxococcota bacterium]
MIPYLTDIVRLYLGDFIDWGDYFRLRKGDAVDVETETASLLGIAETGARICRELEPSLREGWNAEARLEEGEVVYPPHIETAYRTLADAGLVSFAVEERYGGFGLPALMTNILLQMIARADAGLMTLIGLQAGVADDIQLYASEELRKRYLPRFASGEVMGAMDLTEPSAGSDLGGITTRAIEREGAIVLQGQKIFITNGGSEVHLVLARDDDTFEDSKGTTRGLSLYLCPRTLEDGQPNGIRVVRLESKLGIHGSPTAAIEFHDAEAYLVGVKGEGFKAMLTLMNNARLGVGAQGIGIAEAALDAALSYARERKQFGIPIGDQPLMKNILARMIVALEGSRALLYRTCVLVDRNRAIETYLAREGGLSESERARCTAVLERNEVRIRLLTPLAKYLATESCDEITRYAIQVHGGLGYMAESVVGKLHNDGIITTIYEGTSEIQVSFALREIGKGALTVVFDEVRAELEQLKEPALEPYGARIREGIDRILECSPALLADPSYALLSAQSLAEVVISVIVGAELLKQSDRDPERLPIAATWVERRMNDLAARTARIAAGSADLLSRCEKMVAAVQR